MNITKSEVKISTLREIGKMLEDGENAARSEIDKCRGAKSYLSRASNGIKGLNSLVSRDLDNAKLEFNSPLEVSTYVSDIISKAAKICDDLQEVAERESLISAGRIQAMQVAIKNVEKKYKSEIERLDQFSKNLEAVAIGEKPLYPGTGLHPGISIKERRQMEDKKEIEVDITDILEEENNE